MNAASQARIPGPGQPGFRSGTGSGRARAAPTRTAPSRAGRTGRRSARHPAVGGGARAPPEVKGLMPPLIEAVGGALCDLCTGPCRAGGGGEQWTTCHSECEPPRPPKGNAGQGKEEGTQGTLPQVTGRQGQLLEVGQKGNPGQWGYGESQGPTEQHSGGKSEGIQDTTGERRCCQRPTHIPLQK